MSDLFNGAQPLIPVSEREALKKAILKIKARKKGNLDFLKVLGQNLTMLFVTD